MRRKIQTKVERGRRTKQKSAKAVTRQCATCPRRLSRRDRKYCSKCRSKGIAIKKRVEAHRGRYPGRRTVLYRVNKAIALLRTLPEGVRCEFPHEGILKSDLVDRSVLRAVDKLSLLIFSSSGDNTGAFGEVIRQLVEALACRIQFQYGFEGRAGRKWQRIVETLARLSNMQFGRRSIVGRLRKEVARQIRQ